MKRRGGWDGMGYGVVERRGKWVSEAGDEDVARGMKGESCGGEC